MSPTLPALVVVDVQERIFAHMHGREPVADQLERLVRAALALGMPILWTEQNPSRMGPTSEPFRTLLAGLTPIPKMHFSCAGEPAFMRALEALGPRTVVLAGIETHVCIYQTAAHLLARGYAVQVPADAVTSRAAANVPLALDRMRARGADITCVESVLFECMGTAEHPAFREVLKLVK